MSRTLLMLSAVAFASTLSASALAKTEKEFVADAIAGDSAEIALGQLAQVKSGSGEVRAFAQVLIDDHTRNKRQAATVAAKFRIEPPDELPPEAREEMSKLEGLSGADFDKEFVRYMVADHEKDIAEFRQESADGAGAVQQLAAQSLPTLEKHLEIAKSLEAGK
ncbi:putative membrane protein [Roseiarcus fermentans]|uniref:Putative membrane protein n=1 Tax=Roseiarcus fermentans TaxID=1473586 RepID=A0A366FSN0_9HYPH|nr:DUF4142 domain-containing protein [Roseiarcus fermentans]RBP17672.1 putative membrane protein [Roseiarcus fermentans]